MYAVLVVLVPDENVFYAQKVSEIDGPFGNYLSLADFAKLKDVFTKVSDEHISHYKAIAISLLQLFMSKTQKEKYKRS
jgi:hypothetical protein